MHARWRDDGGNVDIGDVFEHFAVTCKGGNAELIRVDFGLLDLQVADGGERNARHERMGDTRYVLEPNIKEGKGGLRDLQTLFWIA